MAFVIAGASLGALAAFAVRDRSSSDPGLAASMPPSGTLAPLPTSAVGTAPATEPGLTPEPTGRPTSAPADPSTTSLAAFGQHVSAAVKEGADLLQALRRSAQAFDIKTVRTDAAALGAWSAEEADWLAGHPAEACYAEVHAEYARAIEDFGRAARITERFAEAFPFADFDELQRAIDLGESGSVSLQEAARLVQQVRC
ncbi:MAG: hypothetical protein ABWY52_09060 [Candidatus Limnocylindrales bacterium]